METDTQPLFQNRTAAAPIVWAVGFECTAIPQSRPGHRPLDEYALTAHDRHWRADLDRVASLGVRAIRYGVPWHRVNPAPGRFDWSWIGPVLSHLVRDAGLTPILDLVHFGTPEWLERGFLAPDYPARVAEYARAVAERFGDLATHWTPFNEPSVAANRSGRDAAWPPYRRGPRGHSAVLLAVARGIVATAEALRAVQPGAVLVHVDDAGIELADSLDLADFVLDRQRRRWLALDLITGRVGPDHPLWESLRDAGALPGELAELAQSAPRWDVLGLNFYPWSNRRWRVRPSDGAIRLGRDPGDPAEALSFLLREAHGRYGLPLMVTETSASGSLARRLAWMQAVADGLRRARGAGVPALGLCWYPAFTMIDWRYRRSRRGVRDHLLHLGLWDIPLLDGSMERVPTPLVAAFRDLARPHDPVLGSNPPLRPGG